MQSAFVIPLIVACGGAATPPSTPPAPSQHVASADVSGELATLVGSTAIPEATGGVALPTAPKAYVIAAHRKLRMAIAGGVAFDIDPEAPLGPVLHAIHAKLPPDAACARGATPETAVRYIRARAEPPHPSDAVLVVDAEVPSSAIVGIVAMLAYPTVIAVRDPSTQRVHVLPLRFCAVYSEPPAHLPSALEVMNSRDLIVVASGGFAKGQIGPLALDSAAEPIGAAMRDAVGGAVVQSVRVFVHSEVHDQHFVNQLVAALSIGTRDVVVQLQRPDVDQIEARFERILAEGGVDGSRARSVILPQSQALQRCYRQAAFVNPALAGKLSIRAIVSVGGAIAPAIPASIDTTFGRCLGGVLSALVIPHVTAVGSLEVQITLARWDPTTVQPSSDIPALHSGGN